MGYYTEAGKKLEVFNSRYKVKLLLGIQVAFFSYFVKIILNISL